MKSFLKLSLLFSFALSFAQTHRFFYEMKFLNDTIKKEYLEDVVVLDINSDSYKFYSNNNLFTDSLRQRSPRSFSIIPPKFKNKIYKKFKSDVFVNYENIYKNYYSFETLDKLNWKILPDKDKIGNYTVQKAETDFGGRHWIAWFTEEIPFPYGPYKFAGLPGLILKISDSKNQYSFIFFKNKNFPETQETTFFFEKFYGESSAIPITEKQFHKIKIDYFLDPYNEMKSGTEKVTFYDENGLPKTPNFNEMTKNMQRYIMSCNNPIEIDKSIKYPEK